MDCGLVVQCPKPIAPGAEFVARATHVHFASVVAGQNVSTLRAMHRGVFDLWDYLRWVAGDRHGGRWCECALGAFAFLERSGLVCESVLEGFELLAHGCDRSPGGRFSGNVAQVFGMDAIQVNQDCVA